MLCDVLRSAVAICVQTAIRTVFACYHAHVSGPSWALLVILGALDAHYGCTFEWCRRGRVLLTSYPTHIHNYRTPRTEPDCKHLALALEVDTQIPVKTPFPYP